MFYRELNVEFPNEIEVGELNIVAVHFINEILLQIRFNGELDSTYEVSQKGLRQGGQRFLAGNTSLDEDDESEEYGAFADSMADYQVATKLGDSNNTKLHVICTQIAELYQQAILPMNVDGMGSQESASPRNLLLTLSSKIWGGADNDNDFNKLVYILKSIKEMYIEPSLS